MDSKPSFLIVFKRFKLICIVSFLWILAALVLVVSDINEAKRHEIAVKYSKAQVIAVQTGFYYNSSVFYPDNTVVILFFADVKLSLTGFACVTGNQTNSTNTTAIIRPVATKNEICPWTTYILICSSVINPTEFSLTVNNLPSDIIIPLEFPSRKPRGIVACYPPMFYEQRWQVITLIHEMNAGFGVDLQVHYVQSVVGQLMKLLDPMVKQGLLEFRGLDIPNYGESLTTKLGYNPGQATEAENKIMALQDCYLRYRESAEFVIVSDIKDLFIPHHGKNLRDEFSYWKNLAPTASAWTFMRNISHVSTTSTLEAFSVLDTLKTVHLTEVQSLGLSVYNPKYAETPFFNATTSFDVPPGKSYGLHLMFNYDKPPVKSSTTNITKIVDISRFENHIFIDYNQSRSTITDLANRNLGYIEWITQCRDNIQELYTIPKVPSDSKICPTATSCDIPEEHVNCTVAVRSYKIKCTQDYEICAMLSDTVLSKFVKRSNGCTWGIGMPPFPT